MLAAVWGNIPANSGLSSSSALVSAAALSTVRVSQVSRLSRDDSFLFIYNNNILKNSFNPIKK